MDAILTGEPQFTAPRSPRMEGAQARIPGGLPEGLRFEGFEDSPVLRGMAKLYDLLGKRGNWSTFELK